MNRCIFIGRATRDPDIRYTNGNNNMCIAKVSIAVDRKVKKEGEPTADFLNFIAFGKIGEFFEKYVKKGTKLAIESHVQTGNYTNKDGVKVYTTDFIVDSVEFCESKTSNSGNQTQTQEQPKTNDYDWMNVPNNIQEELPFQ